MCRAGLHKERQVTSEFVDEVSSLVSRVEATEAPPYLSAPSVHRLMIKLDICILVEAFGTDSQL